MISLVTCTEEVLDDLVSKVAVDERIEPGVIFVGEGELQAASICTNTKHTTRNLVNLLPMSESVCTVLYNEESHNNPTASSSSAMGLQ
jgi:hypothetical protein